MRCKRTKSDPPARLDICGGSSDSSTSSTCSRRRRFRGLRTGGGVISLFANGLYFAALPPGLWLYHVRLASTFPSEPHLLHVQNQAIWLLGSIEGRDIWERARRCVVASRMVGRKDLGNFTKYRIGVGHTIDSIETKLKHAC